VLELPTSNGDPLREFRYEYMTLVHEHPVVNGHSGYTSPLIKFFGGPGSPFYEYNHLDAAFAMASALGIRYLVSHRGDDVGDQMSAAILRAAAANPELIWTTRDFGSSILVALPYQPLPPRPPHARLIPRGTIRATASHSADRLPFAFDGDPDSRWLSGTPQTGNEWIDLQLDGDHDVAFVRMMIGERSFGDYPRRLAIDVAEGAATRTVFEGTVLPRFAQAIIGDGAYPNTDVLLPPNHAHRVRLRQTSTANTFFWSIHELQLWER
jgi:hypothetical protein